MSNASPPNPNEFTLFIDRDSWSGKLGVALKQAQIPFEAHHEHFAHDTPDPIWLREIGKKGWLVITRDQNIRRKPNELAALREAGVILFAFTSGNLSAQETADIAIKAWPKIQRIASETTPPAIFSITRNGEVNRIAR